MRAMVWAAALAAVMVPAVARADDPNDPAMRTRAARERDRQEIRRLNLEQLAYVQRRDAGYAAGWRGARGGRDEERRDLDDYARARRQYSRDLAAWRERVAACNAGEYEACQH